MVKSIFPVLSLEKHTEHREISNDNSSRRLIILASLDYEEKGVSPSRGIQARTSKRRGRSDKKGSIITGEMKRIESLNSPRLVAVVPGTFGRAVVAVVTDGTCRNSPFQVPLFISRNVSRSRFPQTPVAAYYFVDFAGRARSIPLPPTSPLSPGS